MGICNCFCNQTNPQIIYIGINSEINSGINNGINSEINSRINSEINIEISYIKCIYEIKDNRDIQIINDREKKEINQEIKTKIKILNGKVHEKLVFKKNLVK